MIPEAAHVRDLENHPSRIQASHITLQRPPQQTYRFCERSRQGSLWVGLAMEKAAKLSEWHAANGGHSVKALPLHVLG